jgi:hypothetical protein
MALTTPAEREFQLHAAGFVRDKVVLANFREGLRALSNPETGQPFTEDEIQRATQPGSRWYVGAQAIDDFGQGEQRRALWLADQIRLERASTKWLEGYHARLWGEDKLAATGGSGEVTVPGANGTIVLGSATLGDPSAYTARDPAGNVYQVLLTESIPSSGTAEVVVTMGAVGGGAATNLSPGTKLTWVTRDPNMAAQATVATQFAGGTDRETDAEHASRIAGIIRHRPGGGNDAQQRAWARASSNAIEDGFVYPCAFYAGSLLISIVAKRTVPGPIGRKPDSNTLANAIAYLTPPLSPVANPRSFVLVTSWSEQYADLVLRLSLQRGSSGGWLDARPFPSYHATTPQVVSRVSDTDFNISCPGDLTLPGQLSGATLSGASAPRVMLWNRAASQFVSCAMTSVQDLTGSVYRILLAAPPAGGVSVGQRVSPAMAASRHAIVSRAIESYFDELGPGELFDLPSDVRGGRCVRFVSAIEEKPFRAGAIVATRVIEALGGSAADGALASISQTVPTYPSNLMAGPNMLVCGHVGVYEI